MKKQAFRFVIFATVFILGTELGFPASKEVIQMMTQLDNLQQQVQTLQRTVDTQTAVLKTLVQQTNDSVNGMKTVIGRLQEAEQQNLASTANQFNVMNGQVQELSASLDEAKGEISKLSDQLAQTQKILQTINVTPPANTSTQGQPGSSPNGPAAANGPLPIPDPSSLYNSAYADYTQGQYALAIQGFTQYLQDYGDTDLASNAQFYIGDSYYLQKKYKEAIQEYDQCIERYPKGNKTAAAYLKKGYALIALKDEAAGRRELLALLKRYPHSHEADLARDRLNRLRRTVRSSN
ncbi:MAG: tol-pal system protein YbgF [Terriglobia bacterium]